MDRLQAGAHKPPAVIIIARHGARIDAVDKDWHLTSPTPYNPPLTYGGWIQGRALGAHIASLLKAREISVLDDVIPSASSSNTTINSSTTATTSEDIHHEIPRKVRKHNLIIHSSPFLRCVQTSVAIGAGISQYYRSENEQTPPSSNPASRDISPLASPLRPSTPNATDQWTRHIGKDRASSHGRRAKAAPRTRLRIDGFLGEWLSPDYFDQITPPPASVMMVAGAKSELSKRGETLHRAYNVGGNSFSGHFPGGWKRNQSPTTPDAPNNGSAGFGMSALADALPSESRFGDDGFNYHRPIKAITIRDVLSRSPSHSHEDYSDGYIPPVPSYAVSTSDPIPPGYVAHARDACIDVDYQWDSMKGPQSCGDGGEYGEEWSAMHRRFRNGLLNLLDWYSHEQPRRHHQNHRYHHHNHNNHHHYEGEDDTDTVVVLVTHGPGCNALIGALTNQPVLIDVPMTSLTMAVRKDVFKPKESLTHQSPDRLDNREAEQRVLQSATSLLQLYDVSLVASTEHLRATSNPLSIPQLPSPVLERPRPISIYRHRVDSSPVRFTNDNEETTSQPATRKLGLQRSATINSSSHHHHSTRHGPGLWSSASNIPFKNNYSAEVEESLNHRNERPELAPLETKITNDEPKLQTVGTDARPSSSSSLQFSSPNQPHEPLQEQQPKSQLGLWSSSAAFVQARERESTIRRRWTVTEQQ
ncbi:hypothetical protein UA08_03254 [Talaromyces atroroseus]|uniref:Phosphoglycerate mutase n=1 Tax=Talaromyces atroroseus TaxID=1441469 RepID=A0A225AZN9_TALAT|nr:hypothetical protein UA08_03254 [Talaromyces atroroseus]OKL61179.1 hypothetical protein UA08_03254 [Talaromyces atroroseus]